MFCTSILAPSALGSHWTFPEIFFKEAIPVETALRLWRYRLSLVKALVRLEGDRAVFTRDSIKNYAIAHYAIARPSVCPSNGGIIVRFGAGDNGKVSPDQFHLSFESFTQPSCHLVHLNSSGAFCTTYYRSMLRPICLDFIMLSARSVAGQKHCYIECLVVHMLNRFGLSLIHI